MQIDNEKSLPKYLQLKEIIFQHFNDAQYGTGQKLPTESELIEQFGVSRSTVRQTLAELVSEGIVYKIQGSGTFFAGNSKTSQQRSQLIGVLTPRISYYIYPHLIQGIDDTIQKRRYNIVVATANASPEQEVASLKQLLEKEIDGLLFEPTGGYEKVREAEVFRVLECLNIPVVMMNWAIDELDLSYVSMNDFEGGFKATNYLIEAGHQRIACVYPGDKIPALQRYNGYRKALETHGIKYDNRLDKCTTGVKWDDPGHMHTLTEELIALGDKRPTAMFFFNDDAALRAYDTIRKAGLKIPDDISIMGYDDFEFSARIEVPLTTVVHPNDQIGKWAAEILFDEIENKTNTPPRQMLLKPTIAERDSVKVMRKTFT